MRDTERRRRQTAQNAQAIKAKIMEELVEEVNTQVAGLVRDRKRAKKAFPMKGVVFCFGLSLVCFIIYQFMDGPLYYSSSPADPQPPSCLSPRCAVASTSEEEKEELRKLEPMIIRTLTAASPHTLDRFCDSGNTCYTVVQWYTFNDRVREAQRVIVFEKNRELGLAHTALVMPEIVTVHHLAHEQWRVDLSMLSPFHLMQVTAGFMLEGLSFGRKKQQRVLQIGIGGAAATIELDSMPIDLHLDVVEPEANVYEAVKKWFEFPQSPKINAHLMDGVVFLREAVEIGLTFDSLILDSNSNDLNSSILCPHPVFLQDQVLSDMSKVIGSTGVLSLNLFMPNQPAQALSEVAYLIGSHFRSCSAIDIDVRGQKFLMCTNREGFVWSQQRKRMLKNLAEVDSVMGTNIAQNFVRYNPIDLRSLILDL